MKNLIKNAALLPTLLMVSCTVFAACNNPVKEPGNKSEAAETLPEKEEIIHDVTFRDETGKTISLESLKGKVVFINFWATWCPPCRQEMPSINALKLSFDGNDQIRFLMVDVDGNLKKSTAFMKENNYELPVYAPNSPIPGDFLGNAVPTTVILSKSGKIAGRVEGSMDYSNPEVKKALEALIQNQP